MTLPWHLKSLQSPTGMGLIYKIKWKYIENLDAGKTCSVDIWNQVQEFQVPLHDNFCESSQTFWKSLYVDAMVHQVDSMQNEVQASSNMAGTSLFTRTIYYTNEYTIPFWIHSYLLFCDTTIPNVVITESAPCCSDCITVTLTCFVIVYVF